MKPPKEGVQEIQSPSGLDLNPEPPSPVRLSKRAGVLGLVVVFAVAASVGYGVVTRNGRGFQTDFAQDDAKGVTAATEAGEAIAAQIPNRAVLAGVAPPDQLQPPGPAPAQSASGATGGPAHAAPAPPNSASAPQYREPTAEEKRLAAAYEREMQAMDSPTSAQTAAGSGVLRPTASNPPSTEPGGSQLLGLLRSLQGAAPTSGTAQASGGPTDEYEAQNMQDAKEHFLARARAGSGANYLNSTRTKPVGPYEIKAGWDIPAVLEQALNSDLPGEIKALVREDVYDTATGRYLLIPQGARLVGAYDSRVAYGQDGIQVVWSRLIFPDGSSINLDGMAGQDASGLTGLRHDVDNHYKRLLGFGLLTSVVSKK